MFFSDLVHLDSVSADLRSLNAEGVLSEILDALYARSRIQDKQRVFQALMDREKQGSTAIGNDVAVPHARIEGLSGAVLFVGVSKQGIDFSSPDNKPVHIVILLLTPVTDVGMNLRILASIARFANDGLLTNRIMQAATDEELFAVLTKNSGAVQAPVLENTQGF